MAMEVSTEDEDGTDMTEDSNAIIHSNYGYGFINQPLHHLIQTKYLC